MVFSDSDSEFELLSSQEVRKSYEVCPQDITFKVKIEEGNAVNKFKYILKKGTELPYNKSASGKEY